MTSIRNTRGYIEKPAIGLACWEQILSELRRSANADCAEFESSCSWTGTDSEHGPGVDGGPAEEDANDNHDCQSAPVEPTMAAGILGEDMMVTFEGWIVQMATWGLPISVIARQVGCSQHTVRRVVRRAYACLRDDEPEREGESGAQARGEEVSNDLG